AAGHAIDDPPPRRVAGAVASRDAHAVPSRTDRAQPQARRGPAAGGDAGSAAIRARDRRPEALTAPDPACRADVHARRDGVRAARLRWTCRGGPAIVATGAAASRSANVGCDVFHASATVAA